MKKSSSYYDGTMRELSFDQIIAEIRAISTRNEIEVEEVPAPQRLAPFAIALTATVLGDVVITSESEEDGEEIATGRFVLLHDPEGQYGWGGRFRCVTFVRANIDRDMVSDPLLADVGWTWLLESLTKLNCDYTSPSGTVTRVASSSFGTLSSRAEESELEVRASWTPLSAERLSDHVRAWLEVLEISAGLAPIPEGVSQLGRNNSASASR